MKRTSILIAIGVGLALSAFAQTSNEEKQPQQPAQEETGNVKAPAPDQGRDAGQSAQPADRERTNMNAQEDVTARKGKAARATENTKVRSTEGTRERTDVNVKGKVGAAVTSTSVFRNGRETREHISLHRGTRETTNVHFSIGVHPRDWWLRTYSIVLLEGCHYYLADDGCWYPAYGFDPSCNFEPGVVYCD